MKLFHLRLLPFAASLVFCATTVLSQLAPTEQNANQVYVSKDEVQVGLEGAVYDVPPGTLRIPDFSKLKQADTIHLKELNIPKRAYDLGFPGVDRYVHFAIDFHGSFVVKTAGKYMFRLTSDDGSQLWIDGKLLIDLDGYHYPLSRPGTIELEKGVHEIRIPYFQADAPWMALMLEVKREGGQYHIFNTDSFGSEMEAEQVAASKSTAAFKTAVSQDGQTRINLDSAILFDFDKSTLKLGTDAVLAEIKSSVLDKHPAAHIVIEGHTDDRGSDLYNLNLSQRRAQAVMGWLQVHGIPPSQMVARGYGKFSPKLPNVTDGNRAQNRRVEIVVQD